MSKVPSPDPPLDVLFRFVAVSEGFALDARLSRAIWWVHITGDDGSDTLSVGYVAEWHGFLPFPTTPTAAHAALLACYLDCIGCLPPFRPFLTSPWNLA